MSQTRIHALDGQSEGLFCTHQHDEFLSPGDSRIQQVPLKHQIMLRVKRDDDAGEFGALAKYQRSDTSSGLSQGSTLVKRQPATSSRGEGYA